MTNIYMLNYSVKGIKTLDQWVDLSFYKKDYSRNLDFQSYNVKGIYGMNGSGKSAIVNSVEILKNLILHRYYLTNPIIQNYLNSIIHKSIQELNIEVEYLVKEDELIKPFKYSVSLKKSLLNNYIISNESLYTKGLYSRAGYDRKVFEVNSGDIKYIQEMNSKKLLNELYSGFKNLLDTSSISSLFFEKIMILKDSQKFSGEKIWKYIRYLYTFANSLHIYLENTDNHEDHIADNILKNNVQYKIGKEEVFSAMSSKISFYQKEMHVLRIASNFVDKRMYQDFEKNVKKLYEFLHIFKQDLENIEIDKKENGDFWVCDLIMVYDSYKIHAEYESTGIKKLVKLYAYIEKMVHGDIVFIDEFDSNLHDVYLCALLDYLTNYAKGQLCFTTHNVGLMEVLKSRKKSIDFLSEDHQIYPWVKNGNYSPINLYIKGMIEGSLFNVDFVDFIRVFGAGVEDE